MSLGVCLPGGGAKGAFQAGVLEALYNRGIKKYDSYACTSIGAMNGYYLYTENVDKMKKMCDESYIPEKMKSDFNHLIEERMVILAD